MSLSNFDLQKLADKNDTKIDAILSYDEIKQLPEQKIDRDYYYIINKSKIDEKNGQKHWVALVLQSDPANIIYYDSLGEQIQKDLYQIIKERQKIWFPDYFPKLKMNKIEQQQDNTLCGYFALKFLKNIQRGQNFKDASGYSELNQRYQNQLQRNGKFKVILG